MKNLKVVFGTFLLSAMLFVGFSSFASKKADNLGPYWAKRSCPQGMSGYKCVWSPVGQVCPVEITGKYGIWNCYTRRN